MNPPSPRSSAPSALSYQQVLIKLLHRNALVQVRKIVDKALPADISPVLPTLLGDHRSNLLSILIEAGKAGRVLLELDRRNLAEILGELDDATVVAICSSSAPDDAADLLDALPEERREVILAVLAGTEGARLESLLEGRKQTAGSLMTTEFLALDESVTVASALEAIRAYPRKDSFFYVYTVNSLNQLTGVLSLRNMILASPDTPLQLIMVHNVVRTTVDSSQEEVAQLVSKYDLLSVPVVDAQNHLVGVVTVDDVLDVIQEQAEEDLLHLAGVDTNERVTTSAITSFRTRYPWLAVNLLTAFLASIVVRSFQGTIEKWAALAAFLPVVAGMGGNAGTQTLTVFVRGLALGKVDWKSGVRKELLVGMANGAANGVLTGLIVWLWLGDWVLAGILVAAMVANMLIAGVAGAVVPLALKELKFDPAVASSIFVTTFTDVGGFFCFLGLATLALNWLR